MGTGELNCNGIDWYKVKSLATGTALYITGWDWMTTVKQWKALIAQGICMLLPQSLY